MSTLSSVAKTDPDRIRQSVVALGDGTYCVQFMRNNQATFVRVDGDLMLDPSTGAPAFAGTGGARDL